MLRRSRTDKALTTASTLYNTNNGKHERTKARKVNVCNVAYVPTMYAALIWTEKMLQSKHQLRQLDTICRLCMLRMISAYRTVSMIAESVLTGMLFIELLLKEQLARGRKNSSGR